MTQSRVLVLGAYGLIGQSVVQRLRLDERDVTGLGRSPELARRVFPDLNWVFADLSTLVTAKDWSAHLRDIDCVVNCAGALQDGPNTDLERLHYLSIKALSDACAEHDIHIVQISAAGATVDASTSFLSTKAMGDNAISASGAPYTLFRPGLVIAPSGYGGTTLLRQLAAMPLISVIAQADAVIKTVPVADVARCVSDAVAGKLPPRFESDIVEPEARSLSDIVCAFRHWLGFAPAVRQFSVPNWVARGVGHLADGLAYLGWRSPLRTTAHTVLTEGINGTADPQLGQIGSLHTTLAEMPARTEDRLFARVALLTPIAVVVLSAFWIASGLIGALYADTAASGLINSGWPVWLALTSVYLWSVVDIAIGVALLVRKTAQRACLAAIAVSLFYLAAATVFLPDLWADPLGPLVKVPPSILAALFLYVGLEKR